jgi:hypothetical protein
MPTLARNLHGELDGGIGLRVIRRAVAISRDLGVVELGEVLGQIGMGGEAIIAAVDLGDGESNPLTCSAIEFALSEGTMEPEITFERCRTVGDDTK